MMLTLATLPFQPQADALMAGLASRSHQWTCWDMLQRSVYEIEWGSEQVQKISAASTRTELRVFAGDSKSSNCIFSSLSSHVSPSLILSHLFGNRESLGQLQFLAGSEAPSTQHTQLKLMDGTMLRLQSLDAPLPMPDPWSLAFSNWAQAFPQKPTQIIDLRYRNSLGLFAFSVL